MEYGIGLDLNERTFPLLISFYYIYYYFLLIQCKAQCNVVYATMGCGLVEITPNWAWPIEVMGDSCLLYKEVFTSLLGQQYVVVTLL
ncbi:hypothetical protein Hanom_Chr07g00680461 [Helianthus anomalus]